MALDNAWFGVIATGIGALAGSGPAALQALTARGQRKYDASEARLEREAKASDMAAQRAAEAAAAKAQREFEETVRRREFAAELLPERRAKIAYWQEQLFAAGKEQSEFVGVESRRPNVVGQRWFEELRPYLTGEAADYFADVSTVHIDSMALSELSDEIARIEREWIAEAQG